MEHGHHYLIFSKVDDGHLQTFAKFLLYFSFLFQTHHTSGALDQSACPSASGPHEMLLQHECVAGSSVRPDSHIEIKHTLHLYHILKSFCPARLIHVHVPHFKII